jgi:adenylate kinase family enzyme
MGRRINVVGASGNGKTTVGRALAERLGVPYVELDSLVHGPNWAETSNEDLRAAVEPTLALDGWVVDGNYRRKLGDVLLRSTDTVVWLDLPLPVVLWRLARRTRRRLREREELWNGNRESWRSALVGRESLFAWAVRSYFRHRRELPGLTAEFPGLELVRLRSPAEVRRYLERAGRV